MGEAPAVASVGPGELVAGGVVLERSLRGEMTVAMVCVKVVGVAASTLS